MDFEEKYGAILAGSFVAVTSGWGERWEGPERYRNVTKGNMVFPTFAAETADLLLERNISGIGIDTFSPDGPESGYPVHRMVLGAGKVIIENLANLKQLPAAGATLIALPLKITGGTESPVRAVGAVMHSQELKSLLASSRKEARKSGLKKSDVTRAIKEERKKG